MVVVTDKIERFEYVQLSSIIGISPVACKGFAARGEKKVQRQSIIKTVVSWESEGSALSEGITTTARVRPRSKRQQVRGSVWKMIIDGHYPPGSQLIQQKLAKQLGASVSVIREVLFDLANEGLVRSEENLGFFVGDLTIKSIREAFVVRAVHDGLAARLCCQRASRQDVAELRETIEKAHRLCCSGDDEHVEEGVRVDRRMHDRVIEIAGNEVLLRARRSYWIPVITASSISAGRLEDTYQEHLRVIEAIERNRLEEAERFMREHIGNGLDQVEKLVEAGEADLKWYV